MNQVAEEIKSYFGIADMNPVAKDILMHYGVGWDENPPGRGSGRYPHGSGENPNQHSIDFMTRVNELRKIPNLTYVDPDTGKTYTGETAVYKHLGMESSTQLRVQYSLAKDKVRAEKYEKAMKLLDDGYSRNEVVDMLGLKNESSLRSLMNQSSKSRMDEAKNNAELLKKFVDENGMLDVGEGTELYLGTSSTKLRESLEILKQEGYEVYGGRLEQVTNSGKFTTMQVLCPPGTEHKEIFNTNDIHFISEANGPGNTSELVVNPGFQYPASLDSKRLMINYAEHGGNDKDGVVELRRGVEDISLGNDHYSQVRILVDGSHYIKGMAVYADDLPPGIDVRFNTNKHEGTPVLGPKDNSVLKPIKSDPDNPFGSLIKENGGQSYYIDENGNKKLRLINKTREEGDWADWNNKVPSQFLAKQPIKLVNQQLNLSMANKQAEYDEISRLTNPTVKKSLLESFASDCDSAAEKLKAASFPGQGYHVMLPLTTIKDTEVYAPNYKDGTKVLAVRFPFGHVSEAPILTVNNKNKEGRRVITPGAKDAIGLSKNVADRMSGADYDGDAAMIIPLSSRVKFKEHSQLQGLKGFDPKEQYGPNSTNVPYKRMKNTQNEMGRISNLITDMTIKGANNEELARAIRHSMVVIDAEKHNLDYERSYKDNKIDELKRIYQKRVEADGTEKYGGASTLLSRAKNEQTVDKRQGSPRINKETGELEYKTADNLYYTDYKTGKIKKRTQASTQMAEAKDARSLSTGTKVEEAYAAYANKLKSLANSARKQMVNTGSIKYSAAANNKYRTEVDNLMSQLRLSKMNAPRERQAQVIATSKIKAMKQSNPDMDKKDLKKAKQRALTAARNAVGAKRHEIEISPKQWEAIQSGAVSETKLTQILKYANSDKVRQYATPRATRELSDAKQAQIKAMKTSGYTNAEIAARLNISSSTVSKY